MKLQEYEAVGIFEGYGIPVAKGYVVSAPEEIRDVDNPVVLKAQVTVGKRGKSGGILFAESRDEAVEKARELFGMTIQGLRVNEILVVEKAEVIREYYVGLVIDRESGRPTLIMTSEGGVNIEELAAKSPHKIAKKPIDPLTGILHSDAMYLAESIGLTGTEISMMADIAVKLYRAFEDHDSELAEINPLVATPHGLLAIDAVFNIDNNALYRQKFDRKKSQTVTEREKLADEYGLAYVDLEGDIGIVGSGAGLVMATLDAVAEYGGAASCFLDLGGGAGTGDMLNALEIISMKEGVRSMYLNIFGGITKCDEIARGIIDFNPTIPTVVRMLGTNEEKAKEMLREAGYETVDDMEEGAKKAVDIRV